MNCSAVEKIANAVLYEGYILYPYRPSAMKNRQRFNFGVLYPPKYCALQSGAETSEMRTECLVEGEPATSIEAKVRFLHMAARREWQEGKEREVTTAPCTLESLLQRPYRREFFFMAAEDSEGREWQTVRGQVELSTACLDGAPGVYRLTLRVRNLDRSSAAGVTRDEALLRSLVSVHSILQVTGGKFISLLDPPEPLKHAAGSCQNTGAFPVLAGDEGRRNLLLISPIILYDYPQTAPESPGDLCDGLEIDEILALRILTMTDAEKQEVRGGDDRARRILERTEMLPLEHFQKLHGALRGMRPSQEAPQ
jgi:hypothetical protein